MKRGEIGRKMVSTEVLRDNKHPAIIKARENFQEVQRSLGEGTATHLDLYKVLIKLNEVLIMHGDLPRAERNIRQSEVERYSRLLEKEKG